MRHRFVNIASDVEITNDRRLVCLKLQTETAPPFPLELEVARLDELIAGLLDLAHACAPDEDPGLRAGSPTNALPIPTNGAGVQMGRPGHAMMVFQVGAIQLGLEIENSRIAAIGRELVALGTTLEAEPSRQQ